MIFEQGLFIFTVNIQPQIAALANSDSNDLLWGKSTLPLAGLQNISADAWLSVRRMTKGLHLRAAETSKEDEHTPMLLGIVKIRLQSVLLKK